MKFTDQIHSINSIYLPMVLQHKLNSNYELAYDVKWQKSASQTTAM